MPEWQPIETAPKPDDGKSIRYLVQTADGHVMECAVAWSKPISHFAGKELRWYGIAYPGARYTEWVRNPKYWMPLPAAKED